MVARYELKLSAAVGLRVALYKFCSSCKSNFLAIAYVWAIIFGLQGLVSNSHDQNTSQRFFDHDPDAELIARFLTYNPYNLAGCLRLS